jgi:hypothetical protein
MVEQKGFYRQGGQRASRAPTALNGAQDPAMKTD